MSEWRTIESAPVRPKPDPRKIGDEYAWDEANRVLVCHAPSGRMMIGAVRDWSGDDGVVRRGVGNMSIFMPTHWMPLPEPPK